MHTYTIGDTPRLSGTVNANLTDATMTARVELEDGTKRSAAATVPADLAASSGAWTAVFADGDLDVLGMGYIELHVAYAGGETQTFAYDADGVRMEFLVRRGYV